MKPDINMIVLSTVYLSFCWIFSGKKSCKKFSKNNDSKPYQRNESSLFLQSTYFSELDDIFDILYIWLFLGCVHPSPTMVCFIIWGGFLETYFKTFIWHLWWTQALICWSIFWLKGSNEEVRNFMNHYHINIKHSGFIIL